MPPNHRFVPGERKRRVLDALASYQALGHDRVAAAAVEEAVHAIICGFVDEGLDLARRCVPLLAAASELTPERQRAETNEPRLYWLHSAEATRLWHLALARWLSGEPAASTFRQAAQQAEQMIAAARRASSVTAKEDLDLYMELAVQADDDAHVLAFYESQSREATRAASARQPKSARGACEAVCRHREQGEPSHQDVRRLVDNLLKKYVEHWLTTGWHRAVADFLKIRFADLDGVASPVEVLMHAYDYLPGRTQPVTEPRTQDRS